VRDGMTVLDGLHYIKDNLDASLAWRYFVPHGYLRLLRHAF